MDHITDKDLQSAIDRINRVTGSPAQLYDNGKACIGNYHLSYAYGGVCLHRMYNESGGVSSPLGGGYGTKRELFNKLHAYIAGLESAKGE